MGLMLYHITFKLVKVLDENWEGTPIKVFSNFNLEVLSGLSCTIGSVLEVFVQA
jgi:hypothetical protein